MILTRTPLRISLVGGGTDLPFYYKQFLSGHVVSFTPNLFVDVVVRKRNTEDIGLNGSTYKCVDDVPNPILREAMLKTGVTESIYLLVLSDVSTRGTGLGSSSALLVGAMNALYRYRNVVVAPRILAKRACEIEQDVLGSASGKQDAYASACGGFEYIEFLANGTVKPWTLMPSEKAIAHLRSHLMLFDTGISRKSERVLRDVRTCQNIEALQGISRYVRPMKKLLENPTHEIGEILHSVWELKKQTAPSVSFAYLNDIYETARAAGLIGGKILGAGGGGYFLFYAPPERHADIRKALEKKKYNLQQVFFDFHDHGTQVLLQA